MNAGKIIERLTAVIGISRMPVVRTGSAAGSSSALRMVRRTVLRYCATTAIPYRNAANAYPAASSASAPAIAPMTVAAENQNTPLNASSATGSRKANPTAVAWRKPAAKAGR